MHPLYETVLQHAYNLPALTAQDYGHVGVPDVVFGLYPSVQVGVRSEDKSIDWVICDPNLEETLLLCQNGEKLLAELFDKFLDVLGDLGRVEDIWIPDAFHFVVLKKTYDV